MGVFHTDSLRLSCDNFVIQNNFRRQFRLPQQFHVTYFRFPKQFHVTRSFSKTISCGNAFFETISRVNFMWKCVFQNNFTREFNVANNFTREFNVANNFTRDFMCALFAFLTISCLIWPLQLVGFVGKLTHGPSSGATTVGFLDFKKKQLNGILRKQRKGRQMKGGREGRRRAFASSQGQDGGSGIGE